MWCASGLGSKSKQTKLLWLLLNKGAEGEACCPREPFVGRATYLEQEHRQHAEA